MFQSELCDLPGTKYVIIQVPWRILESLNWPQQYLIPAVSGHCPHGELTGSSNGKIFRV